MERRLPEGQLKAVGFFDDVRALEVNTLEDHARPRALWTGTHPERQ